MIIYFGDRRFTILGQASTGLPDGLKIVSDLKTEDIETGVASFECSIAYDRNTRDKVAKCCDAGNYILLKNGNSDEFYTIIESEIDTKNQEVNIYAEDAGLDLLNEICVAYEADKDYPISHYIEKFAYDSGFVIGINEVSDLSRKLKWEGESTVTERIASVATQFDHCEISYTFEIENLRIKHKYINIHKQRGKDIGENLYINRDIDKIVTTKSIANLATALKVTGGTPEGEENPISLNGYTYDDGDFFLEGTYLKSRKAVEKWSRYLVEDGDYTGHICKTFTYDTTSQEELCNRAVAELKKVSEIEVNYEVDINRLPDNTKLGDRINIIDDAAGMYVSARVLKLEVSATDDTQKATLGEYLIKNDGINKKVLELAEQFAKNSQSAARALAISQNAKTLANTAQVQADAAVADAANAQTAANAAQEAANTAQQSAADAQTAANNAQAAVDLVEENVSSLETTVSNAQAAAEQAKQAAATADTKATEAQQAAESAAQQATAAKEAAATAQSEAETAKSSAATAQTVAGEAKTQAAEASTTAAAAKQDAENAQKDIEALSENLTTLSNTMSADYARKTDLTEAKSSLQTQISQNAAAIETHATQITTIDETANNAAEQAAAAQSAAAAAQTEAESAYADALAAQQAADAAAAAAATAQSNADTANAAAVAAKSVADKAEADLATAQADLATVQGRVDATEEDIASAQAAVITAQAAADKAKADAVAAATAASEAQTTADTAVTNAANAKKAADNAASQAALAQKTADEAKGNAAAAQAAADEAASQAAEAQRTADTAQENAAAAQTTADQAAAAASAAQTAADEADAKAKQAAADLATAEQNLADVTSRVGATEEDVAAAQAAVTAAQEAADTAKANAEAAQATADTAKANAATAQTAADNAKAAADAAKTAADEAQAAADAAQADVDALAVRVTAAETSITQTSEQIKLLATKTEVAQTLGGYYTKEQADAAIDVKANEITSSVISQIEAVQIGGRNIIRNTAYDENGQYWSNIDTDASIIIDDYLGKHNAMLFEQSGNANYVWRGSVSKLIDGDFAEGDQYTLSGWAYVYSDIPADANIKVNVYGTGASGNVYLFDMALNSLEADKWVYFSATAQVPSNFSNGMIFPHIEKNGKFKLANLKLEKGNKATDWSPAPEDMASVSDVTELSTRVTQTEESITSQATSISGHETRISTIEQSASSIQVRLNNAEKVATNFLSYDSTDGLLIGNKSSGSWNGYRTQMKSDSFNILDSSGNMLASYGANDVYLGANSQDTVIHMCNDLGTISYDSSFGSINMQASNLSLISGSWESEYGGYSHSYIEIYGDSIRMFSEDPHDEYYTDRSGILIDKENISINGQYTVTITSPSVSVQGNLGVDGSLFLNGKNFVETGTWTPVLINESGSAPTYTTGWSLAYYIKIGKLVFISVDMAVGISNKGGSYAKISGLPYTCGSVMCALNSNETYQIIDMASGDLKATFRVMANTKTIRILTPNGSNSYSWKVNTSAGTNAGRLRFSGVYGTDI